MSIQARQCQATRRTQAQTKLGFLKCGGRLMRKHDLVNKVNDLSQNISELESKHK